MKAVIGWEDETKTIFKFVKADSSYLPKSPYDIKKPKVPSLLDGLNSFYQFEEANNTKKPTTITQGEYRKMFEDAMLAEVDTWDEVKAAYIYKILYARNHRIDSVTAIVRRAVFEGEYEDWKTVRGKVD